MRENVLQFKTICATRNPSVYVEENMKRDVQSKRTRQPRKTCGSGKLREIMAIAEEAGLLGGERTQVVRGRMPEALVARAKKRTGINSDTELIELALANIAVQDDYAEWLLSRRGAVHRGADLEF
jgi:hypothetical protein